MKELSSLRMAPPDMIVLASRRGEKKEKVINSKRKTFALYSIQAFNFLSMWSRIDDDTWRFMEKFS